MNTTITDFKIPHEELSGQCTAKTTQELLQTKVAGKIAKRFSEHDKLPYKTAIMENDFEKLKNLKDGESLDNKVSERLLEVCSLPDHNDFIRKLIATHKNVFSIIVTFDEKNNRQTNIHPLWDTDGKFLGLDAIKQYITEHTGMSEELIQEAIDRNKDYDQKYNTDEQVRKVCSKLNYTRESLGNGRVKHTIDDMSFSFPRVDEFTFADMREDGKYTMDGITKTKKYEKFQQETGMNKLSPEEVYKLLGKFAKAMDIKSPIDYDFFKGDSEESQGLLQMFRNITGFEGKIPLKIIDEGNVQYLDCRDICCCFDDVYLDYFNVAFLSGRDRNE